MSFLVAMLTAGSVAAASYPTASLTLVAPVPAGGAGDTITRIYAGELNHALRVPVVVENRAGANTAIGTTHVARARPDGGTLLVTGSPTFTINPALRADPGYAPEDFAYVGIIGAMSMVLVARSGGKYDDYEAFVTDAKMRPGELSYGSFGNGSMPHLTGASLAERTGLDLIHVPYKGSAPAQTDLLGGHLDVTIDSLLAILPQVRSGAMTPLAIASAERSPLLPDVPTFAELGVEDFVFETWVGIVAPRQTPPAALTQLEAVLSEISQKPSVVQRFQDLGFRSEWIGGEAFTRRAQSELEQNRAIIRAVGIEVE